MQELYTFRCHDDVPLVCIYCDIIHGTGNSPYEESIDLRRFALLGWCRRLKLTQ